MQRFVQVNKPEEFKTTLILPSIKKIHWTALPHTVESKLVSSPCRFRKAAVCQIHVDAPSGEKKRQPQWNVAG